MTQRLRQRRQQRGDADGHRQPGADRDDHAAGGRNALQRRHGRSTTRAPATDPEDGTLPASAFTWRVDFHHDTHIASVHRRRRAARRSGSFTIPTAGRDVGERLVPDLSDSARCGRADAHAQRDIVPRKAQLTLATNPAGLQLTTGRAAGCHAILVRQRSSASCGTSRRRRRRPRRELHVRCRGPTAAPGVHTRSSTPAANTTYTATFRSRGGVGTGSGSRGNVFRQRRSHRHIGNARTDPGGGLRLGSRPPGARHRRRHVQRRAGRARCSRSSPDLHILHAERRWRTAVGQR